MNTTHTWKDTAGCVALLAAMVLGALMGLHEVLGGQAQVAAVTFSTLA
jgi:hypothetical protein